MNIDNTVKLSFPTNMEYIPSVRKLFADCITAAGFNRRFSFRSEIVIDELCNNAIRHGSQDVDEYVTVYVEFITNDSLKITVENFNAELFSFKDLQTIINEDAQDSGRGIKIVKILGDSIKLNKKDCTSISVTRKLRG